VSLHLEDVTFDATDMFNFLIEHPCLEILSIYVDIGKRIKLDLRGLPDSALPKLRRLTLFGQKITWILPILGARRPISQITGFHTSDPAVAYHTPPTPVVDSNAQEGTEGDDGKTDNEQDDTEGEESTDDDDSWIPAEERERDLRISCPRD
jgi:hypothetical protein